MACKCLAIPGILDGRMPNDHAIVTCWLEWHMFNNVVCMCVPVWIARASKSQV
jgi:hypothetical protein